MNMQNVCRPSACSHLGIVRHEGAGDLARRMPSHITRAIVLSTGRSDKPCEPDLYCYERLGSCPPGRVCLATALLTCQIAPSLSLSDKAAMLLTQNAAASPQQGATAGKLTIALLLPMCTAVFFCGFALGHWHASSYDVGSVGKLPGLRFRSSAGFRRGLDKDVNRFVGHASRRAQRLYYVAPSTVTGAGLGIFAAEDLPQGTIWNAEDAKPESTVTFSRAQWDTLLETLELVENAGFNDTGYHRLLTLLNIYTFYNAKRNQMVLLLTPSGFTNHAPDAGLLLDPGATKGGKQGSPHGGSPGGGNQGSPLAGNQGSPPPTTTQDPGAAVASSRISTDPSGVLSATLRDVARGEELLEDYRAYINPWPRGAAKAHAFASFIQQGSHRKQQQRQQQ